MSDERPKNEVHLGMFNRPPGRSLMPGDIIAAGLSVVWVLICLVFFLIARSPGANITFDTMNFVVTALAVLLPVALIWVAAVAARSVAIVREESQRLQAAMDQLRQSYVDLTQTRRLQVIPAAPRASQSPGASVPEPKTPAPDPATRQPAAQASLSLGYEATQPALTSDELIRALHFPETAEDREGFRALRRALKDPRASRLVQASQDLLTFLSQEGVYMDDLVPDRARPEIWRRFAQGERGRPIAMLGGIHDRTSLDKLAARMRSDHIFRDTAHHFLRTFDQTFAALEPELTDAEIAALAETRTFRAFMLTGRVAGTFD